MSIVTNSTDNNDNITMWFLYRWRLISLTARLMALKTAVWRTKHIRWHFFESFRRVSSTSSQRL